jgi:hypothetical protein
MFLILSHILINIYQEIGYTFNLFLQGLYFIILIRNYILIFKQLYILFYLFIINQFKILYIFLTF